uniref:Fungal lipase-type domain-containing protein n=1 Tax=Odontella aurita TaxID=265563 RepID=A0A7S4NEU1_9STRA
MEDGDIENRRSQSDCIVADGSTTLHKQENCSPRDRCGAGTSGPPETSKRANDGRSYRIEDGAGPSVDVTKDTSAAPIEMQEESCFRRTNMEDIGVGVTRGPSTTPQEGRNDYRLPSGEGGKPSVKAMDSPSATNLWQDVVFAIDHSDFAYHIVSVRNAAREGKAPDSILHTPFSLYKLLNIIEDNDKAVHDMTDNDNSLGRKVVLKRMKNECAFKINSATTRRTRDILGGADDLTSETTSVDALRSGVVFVEVDDEKQKEEAVYHICISHPRKTVYVVFRGSATAKDWMMDMYMKLESVKNPVKGGDGLKRNIKVHAGFYEYLMKPIEKSGVEEPRSKFDSICSTVKRLMAENPGYRLFSTGHSLGAALSTLFAFYAASISDDLGIAKSIKCINIGSPAVGNMDFVEAFEHLESKGKIRQFRIVNDGDPIPRMPKTDPVKGGIVNHFNQVCRYRHVGFCLKLYGKISCRTWKGMGMLLRRMVNPFYWFLFLSVLYRFQKRPSFVLRKNKHHNLFRRILLDLKADIDLCLLAGFLCCEGPWNGVKFHSTSRYRDRVLLLEAVFSEINLQDLYSKSKQSRRGTIKVG